MIRKRGFFSWTDFFTFHVAEWSLVKFHLKINQCCWGYSLGLITSLFSLNCHFFSGWLILLSLPCHVQKNFLSHSVSGHFQYFFKLFLPVYNIKHTLNSVSFPHEPGSETGKIWNLCEVRPWFPWRILVAERLCIMQQQLEIWGSLKCSWQGVLTCRSRMGT